MKKQPNKEPKRILMKDEHKWMDSLTVCFSEDGNMHFYPRTDDPTSLAENLGTFVHIVYENPKFLRPICFGMDLILDEGDLVEEVEEVNDRYVQGDEDEDGDDYNN